MFSPTTRTPGWSLEDVKRIFPGQEVVQLSPDGPVFITTRGGKALTIEAVSEITPDEASFQLSYGRRIDRGTEKIVGAYGEGQIRLVRGQAGTWTLAHESMHYLEDAGILSESDVAILRGYIRRQVREGNIKTANSKDIGGAEDRASFLADTLEKPEPPRGFVRRVIERVKEFIGRLAEMAGLRPRTAKSVVRDVESGRVFESEEVKAKDAEGNELYAAMYKSRAANVQEFVDATPQNGNIQKSAFHLRDVGGRPVELATDQVRHIRKHHPDFNEWDRIPDVIEQGRSIPIGNNWITSGPTNIHVFPEGNTSLIVIAAPVAATRNQGHPARTITLTAFRDNSAKFAEWEERFKKENAHSPSDVNQTTSRADGTSSLPRSADAEHTANLFREGAFEFNIDSLDAEVNTLLKGKGEGRSQGNPIPTSEKVKPKEQYSVESSRNPDPERYQRSRGEPLQEVEEAPGVLRRAWDNLIYQAQDRFHYVEKIQKTVGDLPESQDAYLAETRYHGMAAAAIEDFEAQSVDPLLKVIERSGFPVKQSFYLSRDQYIRMYPQESRCIPE